MQDVKLFKILLLVSVLFNVLIITSGIVLMDTLPQVLREYSSDKSEILIIIELILGITILLLWTLSIVGLWKFKKWGRYLLIISIVLTFIMYLIDGVVIMNAWENIFSELFMLVEGVLVSMSFSNEINEEMEARLKTANKTE